MVSVPLKQSMAEIKSKLVKLHDPKSLHKIPLTNGMQDYHKLEILLAKEFGKYSYYHRSALSTALNIIGHDLSEHGNKALLETIEPGRKTDVRIIRETPDVLIGPELKYHNFFYNNRSYKHNLPF